MIVRRLSSLFLQRVYWYFSSIVWKNLRCDDDVKDGTRLREKRESAKKKIIESVKDIESVKSVDCATFDKPRSAEKSVFVSSLD